MTTIRFLVLIGILYQLSTFRLIESGAVLREKRALLKVCYDELGCYTRGNGFFHLIYRPVFLLPQSPETINTTFKLYYRANSTTGYLLKAGDSAKVNSSGFDPNKKLKFLIHGYMSNIETTDFEVMKQAILEREDVNVITVDWSTGAAHFYNQATSNTRVVGAEIARLIKFLKTKHGLDLSKVHLIGHSLGAHTAGYAGKLITDPKISRITGLDPAGPYFENTASNVHLDVHDADFVDVLHTNIQKVWEKGYGISAAIGDEDIYFNDAELQPGCPSKSSFADVSCSHGKVYDYFIATINPTCPLVAHKCESYDAFKRGDCFSCSTPGSCIPVGMNAKKSDLAGNPAGTKYFLDTLATAPFCGNYYKITIVFHRTTSEKNGEFKTKLVNAKGSTTHELQVPFEKSISVEPNLKVKRLEILDKNFGNITKLYVSWKRTGWFKWWSATIRFKHITVTDMYSGNRFRFGCNKYATTDASYNFSPC